MLGKECFPVLPCQPRKTSPCPNEEKKKKKKTLAESNTRTNMKILLEFLNKVLVQIWSRVLDTMYGESLTK